MNVTVEDFWYDTPKNKGGRYVLGLVIQVEGLVHCSFYLTIPEMKEVLIRLDHEDKDIPEKDRPRNTAWWADEEVEGREGSDKEDDYVFDMAGVQVEDVPIRLYRDDHFTMTLPHETGIEILDAIKQRLALAGESLVVV